MRVAVLLLVPLALAACGGDEPAAEAVEEQPPAVSVDESSTPTQPVLTPVTTPAPVELLTDSGVTVTAPPVTVPEPLSVAVVGDSLTLAASEQIGVALDAIGVEVVAIDGVESRRMVGGSVPPGVDAIEEILAGGAAPDVWVIALGTNDVGAKVRGDAAAADVRTVLALLPADATVLWVNTWIRDQAGDAALFNNEIRRVLDERPDSAIVDWYAHAKADGTIANDGIHLTDLGEARFAAHIATALAFGV